MAARFLRYSLLFRSDLYSAVAKTHKDGAVEVVEPKPDLGVNLRVLIWLCWHLYVNLALLER